MDEKILSRPKKSTPPGFIIFLPAQQNSMHLMLSFHSVQHFLPLRDWRRIYTDKPVSVVHWNNWNNNEWLCPIGLRHFLQSVEKPIADPLSTNPLLLPHQPSAFEVLLLEECSKIGNHALTIIVLCKGPLFTPIWMIIIRQNFGGSRDQ